MADMHRNEVQWCTTHTIGIWNPRSMSQGKMDIVKQGMECINIVVLGVSELKRTGMGCFQLDNYEVLHWK